MTPTSILVSAIASSTPLRDTAQTSPELLRNDDVGLNLPPDVRIDCVERTAGRRRRRDCGIDLELERSPVWTSDAVTTGRS